ncbi:MAG: J domain-containing protein [Clostridia bacterium]
MDIDDIKRKLRELKRLEVRIRWGKQFSPSLQNRRLVWNEFFSDKEDGSKPCRYPLERLAGMSHEERKEIFGEYLYAVYYQMYKENGIGFVLEGMFDPRNLALFGLPPTAGMDEIKARFRSLAKKYHPDHGGSHEKMVELLDHYHKLMEGMR